ncbi:MAG: 4-hydroxy-tetrahydrodipicolinate reductase [Verrucomicrobia bacterium]|nr:4-hydroxy-tetrahydrodipicolinate reductase [Verrucomicrobiota bacterium]
MTNVAILGAGGRMGAALIRCAQHFDTLKVVAAHDRAEHPDIHKDAGLLAGIDALGFPLSADFGALAKADAFIDFSFHAIVPAHVARAAKDGKAFVLGTTGLTPEETAAVHTAAKSIPLVWAPNMSLGVNVLFDLVEKAARVLDLDYDVEIVETHHRHKKDAPSGTALGLADSVTRGRNQKLEDVACYGREGETGERPRGEIGIHALRAGDVVGDHTVVFATGGERLELSHRASSRDAFAMGALRAAVWAHGRHAGLYTMKSVLGLS